MCHGLAMAILGVRSESGNGTWRWEEARHRMAERNVAALAQRQPKEGSSLSRMLDTVVAP
jgi:hypothetical protein